MHKQFARLNLATKCTPLCRRYHAPDVVYFFFQGIENTYLFRAYLVEDQCVTIALYHYKPSVVDVVVNKIYPLLVVNEKYFDCKKIIEDDAIFKTLFTKNKNLTVTCLQEMCLCQHKNVHFQTKTTTKEIINISSFF